VTTVFSILLSIGGIALALLGALVYLGWYGTVVHPVSKEAKVIGGFLLALSILMVAAGSAIV